jgi:hypothetical protein
MDPVMRALQSIADLDSETRELGQLELASAFGPQGSSRRRLTRRVGGPRILNRDLRALEIAAVETNASEAAGAWDEEMKIDRCDRIAIAPARDVTRHAVTFIGGAMLLALCLVWLAGSDWHFTVEPALLPEKTVKSSADRPDIAKPGQQSASSADAIAAPIGSVHATSKPGVQPVEPSLTKQAAKPPPRTAVGRTDLSKPTAVAETRPTTIG